MYDHDHGISWGSNGQDDSTETTRKLHLNDPECIWCAEIPRPDLNMLVEPVAPPLPAPEHPPLEDARPAQGNDPAPLEDQPGPSHEPTGSDPAPLEDQPGPSHEPTLSGEATGSSGPDEGSKVPEASPSLGIQNVSGEKSSNKDVSDPDGVGCPALENQKGSGHLVPVKAEQGDNGDTVSRFAEASLEIISHSWHAQLQCKQEQEEEEQEPEGRALQGWGKDGKRMEKTSLDLDFLNRAL